MPYINYQFADGHTEEIEVSEEVAATFEQMQKYEKKVERKETRRHISLEGIGEKGKDFSDPRAEIEVAIENCEREERELLIEQSRKEKLLQKKKQLEILLTSRQAKAYFEHAYLKIKKVEIAKRMNITEGAVRKLIIKAEINIAKLREEKQVEKEKELILLRAIFGNKI